MLHIQVHVCFTYHLHISMLPAQGSSRDHTHSCVPVTKKETRWDSCVVCRPAIRPGYISGGVWGGGDGGGSASPPNLAGDPEERGSGS